MITTATLISLITGTLVPALTALITKDTASTKTKAMSTAALSVVAGVVVGILQTPPHGTAQWEQVVAFALITLDSRRVQLHRRVEAKRGGRCHRPERRSTLRHRSTNRGELTRRVGAVTGRHSAPCSVRQGSDGTDGNLPVAP